MAIKQQSLPHYGVKNGMKRNGASIKGNDGEKTYKSIGQAKRFMRTGEAGPSPCVYKQSNAAKYVTRRINAAMKLAQIRAKQVKSTV